MCYFDFIVCDRFVISGNMHRPRPNETLLVSRVGGVKLLVLGRGVSISKKLMFFSFFSLKANKHSDRVYYGASRDGDSHDLHAGGREF